MPEPIIYLSQHPSRSSFTYDTDVLSGGLAEFFWPRKIDKTGPLMLEYNKYIYHQLFNRKISDSPSSL